ncbi:oligosaccharide repeat unit polymerase [Mammaliicoccus sciuri]|uniref:oligosaccharide repeat unit polymerase n=1 Tax=Mammaliicoccus sciuri TaxID=1296 RepID=UPI00194F009D|nr:oligosaccharide repeat unit polymerase [Mammaliicoccus sciuri]
MEFIKILYGSTIFISLFVTIYVIQNVNHTGYKYLFILPLFYALIMTIRVIYTPRGFVIKIIDLIYFIRFILLSFMVVYSGWYEGRSSFPPLNSSFDKAIFYMLFEYLIINVFYYLFLKKYDVDTLRTNLDLKVLDHSKDTIYKLFIVINILFLFIVFDNVSFLGIGHKDTTDNQSQLVTLLTISIYISKYLVMGYIIRYFYMKYKSKNNKVYLFYTVFWILIISSIFVGNNRMDAILPILSTFILLNYLYKNKMRIYNLIISFFMFISIYIISILRNTFDYKITGSISGLITDNIQVYIAGVYNVALSLEVHSISEKNEFLTFFYDLIRPFLGLNLLWRSETIKTSSELFNFKIFGVSNHVTQIIPLIGQFNHAFGWLGIPISVAVITILLIIFLRILRGIYIIEAMLILPLIIRLCITFSQNISIFINELSSIIIIFSILKLVSIFLAKMSKRRNGDLI